MVCAYFAKRMKNVKKMVYQVVKINKLGELIYSDTKYNIIHYTVKLDFLINF